MGRFNIERFQIKDKDEKVVMAAFMNGLRTEELFCELVDKPPRDLEEFSTRAHVVANAEEVARLKRESDREFGERCGCRSHSDTRVSRSRKNVFYRFSKKKAPA